jgi:hypothetical protein
MHFYVQNRLTRRWDFADVNGHQVLVAHWSIVLDNKNAPTAEGEMFPFFQAAA